MFANPAGFFLLACFGAFVLCWLCGAALKFLLFDRFRGVLPRSRRCCRFCKAIALAFPAWQSVSQSVTQQTEQKSEAVEVCVCVGAQPQKLSIKLIIISAFNAKLLHAKCNQQRSLSAGQANTQAQFSTFFPPRIKFISAGYVKSMSSISGPLNSLVFYSSFFLALINCQPLTCGWFHQSTEIEGLITSKTKSLTIGEGKML